MNPNMELLVLILVNIATAVVMYIVFSIRFTRAVQEARKNPIVRELKDNIQITIEFINTSLDLMDEKTKTFYQLVRHSEEIAARLEEAPPSGTRKKSARGNTRKKTSRKKTAAARSIAEETAPEPSPPASPAVAAEVPPRDILPAHSAPDPMERALSGLGADRLDLTPPADDSTAAYRAGEQSAGLARAFGGVQPTEPGRLAGFLSGMGNRIRGLFSRADAPAEPVAAPVLETTAPDPEAMKPAGGDFAGVLSRTGDRLVAKAEKEAAGKTREPRSMNPRDILELSGESAEEIIAQSLQAESMTAPDAAPARTEPPRAEDTSPEHEQLNIEAVLARSGLDLRDRSPGGRADRIKELLRHGFDPRAISAGTGIALPEVELIASLPEGAMRPRRRRRTED